MGLCAGTAVPGGGHHPVGDEDLHRLVVLVERRDARLDDTLVGAGSGLHTSTIPLWTRNLSPARAPNFRRRGATGPGVTLSMFQFARESGLTPSPRAPAMPTTHTVDCNAGE